MIEKLSTDDYNEWNNYPDETPVIFEMELEEEVR
jgi:hypothetical protein